MVRDALRKLALVLGRVAVALFGRVKWDAPGWLRFIGRKAVAAGGWARAHKGLSLGAVALVALVAGGGTLGVRWWNSRPKPQVTGVTITAPRATEIDEKARVNPLLIDFDGSAAPLERVGKVVTSGVTLAPRLDGTWKWESDRQLSFTPRGDWPIGQQYEVELARRGLVPPHVHLSTWTLTFRSAPFEARLAEKEFYQDPVDANLKKVVATFEFSHPVDPAELERRLHLRLVPTDKEVREADQAFHVSYDRLKGKAFVHSEPIAVPQRDANMVITLDAGSRAARGGPPFDEKLEGRVTVPGLYNFLKVSSAQLTIVDNERNEPEQVLVIETSAGVSEAEMEKAVRAWVLPVNHPDHPEDKERHRAYHWSADDVGTDILKQGTPLRLAAVASEKEFATLHSFRFQAEVGRFIYVEVRKGMRAFGGYVLGDTFIAAQAVAPFPRQLRILHSGALLSLSGEKKVSVLARDVPAIRFEIGRILPDQLHHLFTQSNGPFQQPSFNYNFGAENLAEFFTEVRSLAGRPVGKPQYEALDLGKLMKGRGVFLLKAESWDEAGKHGLGEVDQRLVLVSDLGLIVKDAVDGTHDVFVQSIHTGEPVAGAEVQVLAVNGLPALTATTDGEGRARVGSFADLQRERRAVAWLVSKGRDASFLPIGRFDRRLDLSRFDVGGVTESPDPKSLSAFVFSDRGLYRPGEEMRFGLIVRSRDWQASLDGVPVQAVLTDARGLTVRKEIVKLGAAGFEELRHTTPEVAPTGTYTLSLFIVREGRPGPLLGSTTVRVREFMPDRLKIAVHLSSEAEGGWVSPKDLKGRVTLTNLFGTPATGRTVKAELHLTPALPSFGKLRDYRFFDPLRGKESFNDRLTEAQTDDEGVAELDLSLQRFAPATYRLSLLAEGFEAEGGKGVAGEVSAIVSPLAYLVGYKPDGDLSYLSKGSDRAVELVAVGPKGDRVEARGLRAVLYERKYVSVLTRQESGTYKYESVKRELEVSSKATEIPEKGRHQPLATDRPGDFALVLRNAAGDELQRIEYSVAGTANLSRSMEKNAELELQLKQKDVEPGQEIEIAIRAPFTGAGLITVERDKVYAHRWFKSDTTATVQHIRLPEQFEGDGYVAVTFVRDPSSDEIFMSPLSHGVQPFSVSRARRTAKVTVACPDLARPGEPYKMRVSADRPTRAVIMAVDEGILRVARHETPAPLAYFFRKRALGVRTAQILDLILPEHAKLMAALAPGGDDEAALAAHLNPFKRRHQKPVAWWSGIVDVGPEGRELTYDVPDSFNGTLRVMAVAVAEEAIGIFEKRAIVRGDFVLSPSAPVVVAPGDQFEVPVTVANNVVGSGKKARVRVQLQPSSHLEVVGPAEATVAVDELREDTARFTVRAKSQLGAASLAFTASLGGKSGRLVADLSVRPATPYLVTFRAGHLKEGSTTVPVERQLYPEHRSLQAGISHLPLGLTHGLVGYLAAFPHGCTEQVTSQAVPAIVLGHRPEFGFSVETAAKSVEQAIAILRTRQNDEGAFGLWAASPRVQPLVSVYALHVLTEAKERGLPVPAEMLKSGTAWLQQLAREDRGDGLADDRTRAYAVYVLTRNGMVTSGFATSLQKHLEANYPKVWRADLAGAYLAATYQLLRQERLAASLIESSKLGGSRTPDYAYYDDGLAHDAQLLYLLARHFPERAARVKPEELNALLEPIFKGTYNTFSSAHTILALEAFGRAAGGGGGEQVVREVAGAERRALKLPEGLLPLVEFSPKSTAIEMSSQGPFGSYWLVNQRGFDLAPPAKPIASKVEVFREYTDDKGKVIDRVTVGDEIQAHVRVRALGEQAAVRDLAIVDLIPGGFEVVVQAPAPEEEHPPAEEAHREEGEHEGEGDEPQEESGGDEEIHAADDDVPGPTFSLPIALPASTFGPDYGDVREDRVVLYGAATGEAKEFVYTLKATNVGSFAVPPVIADSMYDRSVVARGVAGRIEVVAR